ncbi:blue light receptor [Onygenales sp. PD_40]|nr:blue light receptor [Onygenales sp. PD_40]KAK2788029.1 blue light receptor [Emmonsiellopsis sp. PD_33]KAK2793110.1 blue light receptor [Onygenales sp. PD_10]
MSGYDDQFARRLPGYPANLPTPGLSTPGTSAGDFNSGPDPDRRNSSVDTPYRAPSVTGPFQTCLFLDGLTYWSEGTTTEDTDRPIPPTSLPITNAPLGTAVSTDSTQPDKWMHNILGELRDLIQILDLSGKLVSVSPSCKALTGYEPADLIGSVLFEFIHVEDRSRVVKHFREAIDTGNPFRCYYRFKQRDNTDLVLEAYGRIDSSTNMAFSIIARPYLTKNSQLLDSFLENKLEHERLIRLVAESKREGVFELGHDKEVDQTSVAPHTYPHLLRDFNSPGGLQFGPPTVPPSTYPIAAPQSFAGQNLEVYKWTAVPQNNITKPFGFDGSTYLDDIELMTGLHYRAGERSRGISTGRPGGTLVQSDTPTSVLGGRDNRRRSNDRKRRIKPTETHFCTDCGTFSSPEWRKGPGGKKTLCNACGLRWAKQEKRTQQAAETARV